LHKKRSSYDLTQQIRMLDGEIEDTTESDEIIFERNKKDVIQVFGSLTKITENIYKLLELHLQIDDDL